MIKNTNLVIFAQLCLFNLMGFSHAGFAARPRSLIHFFKRCRDFFFLYVVQILVLKKKNAQVCFAILDYC